MIRKKKRKLKINEKLTYALDETRPPRLNFFPFNTRAGTIGTDDWCGTDGRGEDDDASKTNFFVLKQKKPVQIFTCISMSNSFIRCDNRMKL